VLLATFTFTAQMAHAKLWFAVWVCLIFFNVGGNFSLFPGATANVFGAKHSGPNYGLVFTSTIVAAASGSFIMGRAYKVFTDLYFTYYGSPARERLK